MEKNKREGTEAQKNKLASILHKYLNLSFIESMSMIQLSNEIGTACWAYNKKTKESKIFINPELLKWGGSLVGMVVEHEVLHYSGYINSELSKGNNDVENIVFDTCINREFYADYGRKRILEKLALRIYKSDGTPVIEDVMNPFREPSGEFKRIWKKIWNYKGENYGSPELEPEHGISSVAMFWELIGMEEGNDNGNSKKNEKNKEKKNEKWSKDKEIEGGFTPRYIPPEDLVGKDSLQNQDIEKFDTDIRRNFGEAFSCMKSDIWDSRKTKAEKCETKGVNQFLRFLQTKNQLDEVGQTVSGFNSIRCQTYPLMLSRLGQIYVACGISDIIPIYWNREPENKKPRISIYIDTSPSMDSYVPQEVYMINDIKENCPAKIFLFYGSVTEIDLKGFEKGEYKSGYSTDFDSVVEHFLNTNDEVLLIFTDGESAISKEWKNKFKESKRKMYSVIFGGRNCSDLTELSDKVFKIEKES